MGRIQCELHGRQPITLVCEHLESDVRHGRAVTESRERTTESDDGLALWYRLCPACSAREQPTPAELERTMPVCGRCLAGER
jgi:hypothetical protein